MKENDAKFEQNRFRLPSRELKDILEFSKMKFFFFEQLFLRKLLFGRTLFLLFWNPKHVCKILLT
ncbi:hypothetical protein DLM78_13450 [Leptospira stimsonii]|uniref:Uncharacterized protein n=1 Tax=Leptospira stimsonii TaxID=2202203 RepID=A0A8B3CSV0_9LEPT|nr:hypothetical protein DLM78_13450 [Leptospira stimsonii]